MTDLYPTELERLQFRERNSAKPAGPNDIEALARRLAARQPAAAPYIPELDHAIATLRRDDEHGLYDGLCDLRDRLRLGQPAAPNTGEAFANAIADDLTRHAATVQSNAGTCMLLAAAALRVRQGVPDGWQLVPVKATAAQRLSMAKADCETGDRYRKMADAMLAVAPKPEGGV